jgi:rare lipoprotein A
MEQMTAAHKTLPFGTVLRVDNLDNGMSTEVRINDRGPFVGNRIIDLSHAAARSINMLGPGTANVRLTILRAPVAAQPGVFVVQFAALSSPEAAEHVRAQMQARYGTAVVRQRPGSPPLWRVLVGQAPDPARAEELAQQIRTEQNAPKAFVIRLDPVVN